MAASSVGTPEMSSRPDVKSGVLKDPTPTLAKQLEAIPIPPQPLLSTWPSPSHLPSRENGSPPRPLPGGDHNNAMLVTTLTIPETSLYARPMLSALHRTKPS